MSVSRKELGVRLRSARERRKITQQTAGAAVGLQRSAISLMESGQRQVSTLELTRLAELYGRPVEWFVNPATAAEEDHVLTLFRAEGGLPDKEMRSQADYCIRLFREGASLKRLLSWESESVVPRYELPEPRATGFAIVQGQSVADQERRRLGLGVAPVLSIPELIGSQGIWTAALPLPDEISGLFLRSQEFGMGILANVGQAPVRRRFSYAHEYGHALMDRDHSMSVTSRNNAQKVSEQRANAFAATLLMPEDGVWEFMHGLGKGHGSRREETAVESVTEHGIRGELRTPPGSQRVTYADIALLGRHFGVSYSAAVWRLRGLDIINASETTALLEQTETAKRYLRAVRRTVRNYQELEEGERMAPAKEHEDDELEWQILPLALEAWRREVISQDRLLEIGRLLRLDDDTTLDLAEAVGAE